MHHYIYIQDIIDDEEGFPGIWILLLFTGSIMTTGNNRIFCYHRQSNSCKSYQRYCYFNLSAGKAADILEHNLFVAAFTAYTAVDTDLVPHRRSARYHTALDFQFRKE